MFYRTILHHRQFRYLGAFYLHSLIRIFTISLFHIFSGIYVYQTLQKTGVTAPQALSMTALFFALIYVVQALSVPLSLWLISRKGLRFCMFWGSFFLICFFLLFFLSSFDPIFFVMAAVVGGLQIALYWTAYHIYLTELTDDKKQGEEIAVGQSLSALAAIGGPAFGGLIIYYFGFGAVFIVMSVLTGLAYLPLKFLPTQKNTISVDVLKTVSVLTPKREQKSYLALLGVGVINVVAVNFWPLYIFPIMAGFIGLGFVGSLIALISTITTITVGFLIDKFGAKKVINILSVADSLFWVMRIFVNNPVRVYTASAAQSFTTVGQTMTLDAMIYERARHDNVVAFIIQREVGLALGQFIFALLLGVLFWFGVPIAVSFIFAAGGALLVRFYPLENINLPAPAAPHLPGVLTAVLGKEDLRKPSS